MGSLDKLTGIIIGTFVGIVIGVILGIKFFWFSIPMLLLIISLGSIGFYIGYKFIDHIPFNKGIILGSIWGFISIILGSICLTGLTHYPDDYICGYSQVEKIIFLPAYLSTLFLSNNDYWFISSIIIGALIAYLVDKIIQHLSNWQAEGG